MNSDIIKYTLKALKERKELFDTNRPLDIQRIDGVKVKKVSSRVIDYANRHRGDWFKPEYSLEELQIAQDTDSYIFKAIQKKVNRFTLAGYEIVGNDEESLTYIKNRLREIELVSGQPLKLLLSTLASDLSRYSNCIWVKVRNKNASSGKLRNSFGKELEPVAGYYCLPFETLWFKVKKNGELKKIMQEVPGTGARREFAPEDIVHFFTNKKPGFTMGTPELLPVLEDVALLRRLEESVEDMINANLNPLFHYKVGNDLNPERVGPDGVRETDLVRQTIEYMPSGGVFVSDHRHEIEAVGSEGKALKIQEYIDYFKKRVFAGLGVSPIDMGEGDTANSSTANNLSKVAIQDVEALQENIKVFFDAFIINELLLEGGFVDSITDESKSVSIKFGTVDKEEKAKEENQTIQLWLNNLVNETEARKRLGMHPVKEEDRKLSYYSTIQEPLAMIKSVGGLPSSMALAENPMSSISKENVNKEESIQKENRGRKPNVEGGGANLSKNISRPANQLGERTAPKFSSDKAKLFFEQEQGKKVLDLLELVEKRIKDIENN